ncbi:MAG TPA: hypothetical protein VF406_19915 [Thermodesulfobacteriota bacterium]
MTAARKRGHEYLLERRLLRRRSTGEVIDPAWTRFSFPIGSHYDVLRALEYLRCAGVAPDARMAEAIDLVASKRDANGRWPLECVHPDELDAEPGAASGRASRWITLRALRGLGWSSARDRAVAAKPWGAAPAGASRRPTESGRSTAPVGGPVRLR